MNAAAIKAKLIPLLAQIQQKSGVECPALTDNSKPIDVLPKFDSKVWPVVTTLLSTTTGIFIDKGINIFIDTNTKTPRSIAEIASFVESLANNSAAKAA